MKKIILFAILVSLIFLVGCEERFLGVTESEVEEALNDAITNLYKSTDDLIKTVQEAESGISSNPQDAGNVELTIKEQYGKVYSILNLDMNAQEFNKVLFDENFRYDRMFSESKEFSVFNFGSSLLICQTSPHSQIPLVCFIHDVDSTGCYILHRFLDGFCKKGVLS